MHKCWGCGLKFRCGKDLQTHLHTHVNYEKNGQLLWGDDVYLKPFMFDDALLHSFVGDDDYDDDECGEMISREEVMREFMNNGELGQTCGDDFEKIEVAVENVTEDLGKMMTNRTVVKDDHSGLHRSDKQMRAAREIMNVNENYFGGYGSYGIHREMISDKVLMFS